MPTTWDETRFIDGYPGKYVVLARRHGNRWYVAGLNGTDKPLSLTLSLPMLANTEADLYYEKPAKKALWPESAKRRIKIGKQGSVKVTLQPMGGCIVE